jgi:hypothetical protein
MCRLPWPAIMMSFATIVVAADAWLVRRRSLIRELRSIYGTSGARCSCCLRQPYRVMPAGLYIFRA